MSLRLVSTCLLLVRRMRCDSTAPRKAGGPPHDKPAGRPTTCHTTRLLASAQPVDDRPAPGQVQTHNSNQAVTRLEAMGQVHGAGHRALRDDL